jgi:hypothetical protein
MTGVLRMRSMRPSIICCSSGVMVCSPDVTADVYDARGA